MKIDKSRVKRMLFITLSNIGDIVLTMPVMSALRGNFPDVRLDVMVGPNGKDLFRKHPDVFKLIVYNKHTSMKNKRRLIQKLRKVRYDLIVDMRNSLFPFLLGARYRTSPIQGIHKAIRHKKDEHLSKLNSIGLEIKNASFCVHVPSEDNDFADGILRKHGIKNPIVIIAPGAKSEIKRWSEKNFTLLASRLAHEAGAFVILVGDKADSPIAKNIASGAKKGVVNLAGETTLGALAALLKKSDLLITNDSAPMHLGVAVGAKVLALFGPTDPRLYGPRGRNDRVIRKKLHCAPCAKAQCEFEHECMKSISAEEVFEAAKEMIGKNGSKTHIAHTN